MKQQFFLKHLLGYLIFQLCSLFLLAQSESSSNAKPLDLSDQISTFLENADVRAKIGSQEAQELAQQARMILEQNQSSSKGHLGQVLLLEGIAAYYQGALAQSQRKWKEARQSFEQQGDSLGLARVYFQLGVLEYNQGEFEKSLAQFLAAVRIQEALRMEVAQANSLTQIAWVNFVQDDYDKAFDYYQKALQLYQQNDKPALVARSYSNLAIIFDERDHDLDKALEYQEKGREILEKLGDQSGITKLYNNLGILHKNRKEYEASRRYFILAIDLHKKARQGGLMALSIYNLGNLDFEMKQYTDAIQHYQEALEISLQFGLKDQLRKCYKKLSQIYEIQGAYAKALDLNKKYLQINQEIYNEQKTRQIAYLQENFESEQREKQIQLLKQEKELASTRNRWYITLFIMALLIGIFGFWVQRLGHRKNLQLAAAELQNEQLKQEKLNLELENRNKTLAAQALQIIQKNNLMQEMQAAAREVLRNEELENKKAVKKLVNLVDYSFNLDKEWEEFRKTFENTHPDFFANLNKQYEDLTSSDLKLCALIKLNLNLKETATILGISPDSVKTARYRLRKKLSLSKEEKLSTFLIKF
ncbi:MAG: tetratricopeptide repeat protein [Bacteroidota bacterium]